MHVLVPFLWAAGVVHIVIAAVNPALPRRLHSREHLAEVPPIIRQIFVVHWIYIVVVLLIFAALCLFFAPDLAGASRLGRFLSGAMAVFWLLRIPLQLFYYDPELRRQNRMLDVTYIAAISGLAGVFVMAASGLIR